MIQTDFLNDDFVDLVRQLRAEGQTFAMATIIRTAGSTAAKPGARALLGKDGAILQGWLGGGCTRGAVKKAALEALSTGSPQLVSIAPEDALDGIGVKAGDTRDGKRYAKNGCPSKGSIEIFVEPYLPKPGLCILGGSPVAEALITLAPTLNWSVARDVHPKAYIIVATQGQNDLASLEKALKCDAQFIAFVGSRRKFESLAEKLKDRGIPQSELDAVRAPAGLPISAVTPEEIALSILAELVKMRRQSAAKDAAHA